MWLAEADPPTKSKVGEFNTIPGKRVSWINSENVELDSKSDKDLSRGIRILRSKSLESISVRLFCFTKNWAIPEEEFIPL